MVCTIGSKRHHGERAMLPNRRPWAFRGRSVSSTDVRCGRIRRLPVPVSPRFVSSFGDTDPPHAETRDRSSRVLIAGCGDVGTALGLMLCERGHEVYGARRSAQRLPAPLRPLSVDVTDRDAMERTIPRVDIVVYAVAAGRRDEVAYRRAYVDGVSALLDVLEGRAEPPRHVLFVSSTSVYGECGGGWVDETTPLRPSGFAGESLVAGEQRMLGSPVPRDRGSIRRDLRTGPPVADRAGTIRRDLHRRPAEVHQPNPPRRLRGNPRPPGRPRRLRGRGVHRCRRRTGSGVRGPGVARGPARRTGAASGPGHRCGGREQGKAVQQCEAPRERLSFLPSHLPRGIRRGARGRWRTISVSHRPSETASESVRNSRQPERNALARLRLGPTRRDRSHVTAPEPRAHGTHSSLVPFTRETAPEIWLDCEDRRRPRSPAGSASRYRSRNRTERHALPAGPRAG